MAISTTVRLAVVQRAAGCCEYCLSQASYSATPFSIEHIQPVSQGGRSDAGNLALACQGCNNFKYTAIDALDPLTGSRVPLYNPRVHTWSEHFQWTSDGSFLLGTSKTGRATISRLKLNREGIVNLRRTLVSVGKHPPQITPKTPSAG